MSNYDDDLTVRVVRGGICMGDDVDEHSLVMTFKRYDCPSVLSLIRMIDIWLIETDNVVWNISLGHQQLGNIAIDNGVHSYLVVATVPLWSLDLSKKITCFINRK